ncbi:hypothetical protein DH2020_034986 [Rehmannia glutinosa]|uniref:Uncharacterized protein n=1 Tax=Rehmannia glutinosa TaxID=99300 RepID=A0ABR0VAX5_REHGL
MGKRKSPEKASDREKKWDKVFNALVKLSQNLQKDRHFLEDRIKSLHEVIYKMKMEQKVESVKAELLLGLKEREAFIYKHRYDDVSNKGEGSRNKALQNEVRKLKSEIVKCKLDKNIEISALLAEKNFIWNQFEKMEIDLNKEIRKKDEEVKHANEKVQLLLNREEELQMSNDKLRIDFTKMESESVQKSEEIFRLLKEIELLKSRSGSAPPLLRPCRTGAASQRGGENSTSDGGVIKVKKESDPSHTSEKSAYGAGKMDWTYAADTQHMSSGPLNLPIAHKKQSAHKSTGGKAPRKQFITKDNNLLSSAKIPPLLIFHLFHAWWVIPCTWDEQGIIEVVEQKDLEMEIMGYTFVHGMNKGSSSSSKRKAVDVITIEDSPKLFTSSFKIPKLKSSSSPKIV